MMFSLPKVLLMALFVLFMADYLRVEAGVAGSKVADMELEMSAKGGHRSSLDQYSGDKKLKNEEKDIYLKGLQMEKSLGHRKSLSGPWKKEKKKPDQSCCQRSVEVESLLIIY